jgi:hypothetical protein
MLNIVTEGKNIPSGLLVKNYLKERLTSTPPASSLL